MEVARVLAQVGLGCEQGKLSLSVVLNAASISSRGVIRHRDVEQSLAYTLAKIRHTLFEESYMAQATGMPWLIAYMPT